jgi:hypothetical protein
VQKEGKHESKHVIKLFDLLFRSLKTIFETLFDINPQVHFKFTFYPVSNGILRRFEQIGNNMAQLGLLQLLLARFYLLFVTAAG